MNDRHVLSIELDGGLYTLKIATLLTLIPIISILLLHSGSLFSEKEIVFLTQTQIPPPFFSITSIFSSHSLSGRFGKMSHPIKIFVCYVCADKKKLAPYVKLVKKLILGGPFWQARSQNGISG